MGWLKTTLSDVTEATAAAPIECPRGWGQVSFNMSFTGAPPFFFSVARQCPIAGVENCSSCKHPFNPHKTEMLRDELVQLRTLVDDGLMSDAEYFARRRMMISFQQFGAGTPGSASAITAFILVPLGALLAGAGWWCGQNIHPGFWAMAAGGALVLALGGSFAGISYWRRRELDELFSEEEDLRFGASRTY